ncbi:AaceriACR131Cp [[Ashbya] aceris (nom. inval.)]|nr:AaceriACR131Cp [[Ashbya] aceris (nom. inval.)]
MAVVNELRQRTWSGMLNVEVVLNPKLVVQGMPEEQVRCHLRVPRESYLVLYLPFMLNKLRGVLRQEVKDAFLGWWFGMEDVLVHWNHPVGTLYDSLVGLRPQERAAQFQANTLTLWTLTLNHSEDPREGSLPLVGGMQQVEDFWRHQWKQACYIIHGSSKQIMSLSIPDSKTFWDCVLQRDERVFRSIASRITSRKGGAKALPVRIHQTSLHELRTLQPTVKPSAWGAGTLGELLRAEVPECFKNGSVVRPVVHGIEVSQESQIADLYHLFCSFDGFLHISICSPVALSVPTT